MTTPLSNPFPGLRPFQMDEEHLFFGRESQRRELLALLREQRFVAVLGASGSGKSSLVRAGLLPALYGGALTQAGSHWHIALMRPGGSPLANLAAALRETDLWDDSEPPPQLDLETTLTRSSLGLVEAARHARLPARSNLLIVVDQFEELFRFNRSQSERSTRDEAAAFVTLLLEATRQPQPAIYVVLTMRSDFFGDCAQFEDLADAINHGEYLVPRLTRDQKKQAIEGPIRVGGGTLAPALLQRLLNDVGDDPDQLPILQHALMRTWDQWVATGNSTRPIDLEDYEAIGGLREALSRHADEVFAALPDDRRRLVAMRVFKALTERGADNRGVRRPTRLSDLCAIADASAREATEIVDAFRRTGCTFLMPSDGIDLKPATVIDISHESLMRVWVRLRNWVEEEAQSARVYRRLADTATLHAEHKAGLYHDPDLQIALSWREQEQPNPAWAERYHAGFDQAMAFLEASGAARHAEETAREAARQRELDQARALAETEGRRAREQAHAAARLRGFLAALAAVAVLALAALAFALHARRLAQQNERLAGENAVRANEQAELARRQEAQASTARAEAVAAAAQLNTNLTRSFFITANEQFAAGHTENGLAFLARALRTDPAYTPAAAQILQTLAGRAFLLEPPKAIRMDKPIAFWAITPDRRRILTEDTENRLWLWDTSTQTRIADLTAGERGGWFYFSADSRHGFFRRLDQDGVIRVFEAESGRLLPTAIPQRNALGQYYPTPNTNQPSRLLVDHRDDGSLQVWDVAQGAFVTPRLRTGGRLLLPGNRRLPDPISGFSPDGKIVFGAFDDRTVAAWRAADGSPVLPPLQHSLQVSEVIASPDSKYLALFSEPDRAVFWLTLETPGAGPRKVTFPYPPRSMFFTQDAQRLVVIGWESEQQLKTFHVRTYHLATGQEEVSLDEPRPDNFHAFEDKMTRQLRSPLVCSVHDAGRYLKIWDVETGQNPLTLHFADSPLRSIQISPDGSRLLTIREDFEIRLWNVASGRPVTDSIRGVVEPQKILFSPDGERLLVFSGGDSTLRVWDCGTGQLLLQTQEIEGNGIDKIDFLDDHERAIVHASGGVTLADGISRQTAGELLFLDLAGSSLAVPSLTAKPFDARISPDGTRLAVAADIASKPAAILFELKDEKVRQHLRHPDPVSTIDWSPDARRLVTGSADKTARIWRIDTGTVELNLDHDGPVRLVRYSPSGQLILTVSARASVQTWDSTTGGRLFPPQTHGSYVMEAAFSPDNRLLATSSMDGRLRVIDARTGQQIASDDHGSGCAGLAFAPDSTRILSTSFGGHARLLHIRDNRLEWSSAESGFFLDAAFHPNGEIVAAAAAGNSDTPDGRVYVWNWRENRLLVEPLANRGQTYPPNLQFSPDGRLLASGDTGGALMAWDTATGRLLVDVPGARSRVRNDSLITQGAVSFSADGRILAFADPSGAASVLELPTASEPSPDWLPELAERAAGKRVDAHGGISAVEPQDLTTLRETIQRATNNSAIARWALWAITPPASRSIHPGNDLHRDAQALRLSTTDNLNDRSLALRLAPTNGLIYARVAYQRAVGPSRTNVSALTTNLWSSSVRWYADKATNFAAASAETWALRAATFDALGQPEAAATAASRAVELGPNDPNAWYVHALQLHRRGQTEPAYQAFAKALSLLPAQSDPPTNSAAAAGDLIGALRWIAELENSNPLAAANEAVNRLSDRSRLDARKYLEAEWLSRRAVELNPDDAAAWQQRAHALFEPNQHDDALAALRRATDPTPNNNVPWKAYADMLRVHANILETQGRHQESRRYLLTRGVPARSPKSLPGHFNAIDLSSIYTVSHAEDPFRGRNMKSDGPHYFRHFAPGWHELHGIPFDARGAALLLGAGLAERDPAIPPPRAFTNITLNARAHWIHVLHMAAMMDARSRPIARYRLHHANGQSSEINIRIDEEVVDWTGPYADPPNARNAWVEGDADARRRITLFSFENPHPAVPLAALDVVSEMDRASLALLAVTLESPADETALASLNGRQLADRATSLLRWTKQAGAATHAEADRLSRLALVRSPADPEVARARARVLAGIGQGPAARQLLDGPLAQFTNDFRQPFLIASILAAENRFDAAFVALSNAVPISTSPTALDDPERQSWLRDVLPWVRTNRDEQAARSLELALQVPKRDAHALPETLDLTPHFNAGVLEQWYTWKNARDFGVLLRGLPLGSTRLQGVPFDVRGVVQLDDRTRVTMRSFPAAVRGIAVGRKADVLHFLGGVTGRERLGTPLAHFLVHRGSGVTNVIPARFGIELIDISIGPDQTPSGNPVWRGHGTWRSGERDGVVGLYSWENPTPDDPIVRIDFVSTMSEAPPFLIAITAETFMPPTALEKAAPLELAEIAAERTTPAARPGPQTLAYAKRLSEAALRRGADQSAVLLACARYLNHIGDFTNALQTLDRALALQPDAPAALRLRADLITRLHRFDELPAARRSLRAAELKSAIPARAAATPAHQIDLTTFFNRALEEPLHAGVGTASSMWESLKSLPRGSQPLSGIPFDLRGVVVLGGRQSAMRSMTHDFPMAVTNIPANLPATKLHFLQGAGWAGSLPHGTAIAEYHVRYADGQMARVPVRIGDEVRDWWLNDQTKRSITAGTLAWSSPSSRGRDRELGLFSAAWTNPRPAVAIAAIDLVSTRTDGALFVVAITAEP